MIARMMSRLPVVPLLLIALTAACSDSAPLDPDFAAGANGPTSLTATAVSYSQINLAWQDNARSGAFSLRTGTGANVNTASESGLEGSTQYCYKVRSYRITGRRTSYDAFSNVACVTTPAVPVPAAPTSLSTVPRCCSYIDVTWTDNSTDETAFRVHRATTSNGPWTLIAATGANATFFTEFVSLEQVYCYRVLASNIGGDSGPSNADCTAMPATPTNLAGAVSGGAVDLTWTDNSSLEDGFKVERSAAGAPGSVIATLPVNTASYHDAGVTPNNTYTYSVRATRDGGTTFNSVPAQVVVATLPPNPATNVQVTPQSSSRVIVYWGDGSINEQGFRLERSTNGSAPWTTVATVGFNTTGSSDQGLSPEAQVCYRVVAFNSVADAPPSGTDCTRPPAGPTGFTATGVDVETVDFAWTDNSAVEDGYEVWGYDCYYYYSCYVFVIATLGPNTTSFRYQDQTAYWYAYTVVAKKDGGQSDGSEIVYPTAPPSGSAARER